MGTWLEHIPWSDHYLFQVFPTDQSFLDSFMNSKTQRLGVVQFDAERRFHGCGPLGPFRGGPSQMSLPTNTSMQEVESLDEIFAGRLHKVHCLLPLEYNFYS